MPPKFDLKRQSVHFTIQVCALPGKAGDYFFAAINQTQFVFAKVLKVRGALGRYLNFFLIAQQHWSQTEVGWITTISGLLGPGGANAGRSHDRLRRGASAGQSSWRCSCWRSARW